MRSAEEVVLRDKIMNSNQLAMGWVQAKLHYTEAWMMGHFHCQNYRLSTAQRPFQTCVKVGDKLSAETTGSRKKQFDVDVS